MILYRCLNQSGTCQCGILFAVEEGSQPQCPDCGSVGKQIDLPKSIFVYVESRQLGVQITVGGNDFKVARCIFEDAGYIPWKFGRDPDAHKTTRIASNWYIDDAVPEEILAAIQELIRVQEQLLTKVPALKEAAEQKRVQEALKYRADRIEVYIPGAFVMVPEDVKSVILDRNKWHEVAQRVLRFAGYENFHGWQEWRTGGGARGKIWFIIGHAAAEQWANCTEFAKKGVTKKRVLPDGTLEILTSNPENWLNEDKLSVLLGVKVKVVEAFKMWGPTYGRVDLAREHAQDLVKARDHEMEPYFIGSRNRVINAANNTETDRYYRPEAEEICRRYTTLIEERINESQ